MPKRIVGIPTPRWLKSNKSLKINIAWDNIATACCIGLIYYLGYAGYYFLQNSDIKQLEFFNGHPFRTPAVLDQDLLQYILQGQPFVISMYNGSEISFNPIGTPTHIFDKRLLICDIGCRQSAYGGDLRFDSPRENLDSMFWAIYDNRIMMYDPVWFPNETMRRVFLDANVVTLKNEEFNFQSKKYYPIQVDGGIRLARKKNVHLQSTNKHQIDTNYNPSQSVIVDPDSVENKEKQGWIIRNITIARSHALKEDIHFDLFQVELTHRSVQKGIMSFTDGTQSIYNAIFEFPLMRTANVKFSKQNGPIQVTLLNKKSV